jgi:hypothetical protein
MDEDEEEEDMKVRLIECCGLSAVGRLSAETGFGWRSALALRSTFLFRQGFSP